MAYCGKCLHLDVCKTAETCDGHVPRCKHFMDKTAISQMLGKPATRADQLRAMTDEQLADALYKVYCELGRCGLKDLSNLFCDGKAGCITKNGNIRCSEKKVRACILRWFRQPVEV